MVEISRYSYAFRRFRRCPPSSPPPANFANGTERISRRGMDSRIRLITAMKILHYGGVIESKHPRDSMEIKQQVNERQRPRR